MFVEIPLFSGYDVYENSMLAWHDIQPNDTPNYDVNDDSNRDLGERKVTDGATYAILYGAIGSPGFFYMLILG